MSKSHKAKITKLSTWCTKRHSIGKNKYGNILLKWTKKEERNTTKHYTLHKNVLIANTPILSSICKLGQIGLSSPNLCYMLNSINVQLVLEPILRVLNT